MKETGLRARAQVKCAVALLSPSSLASLQTAMTSSLYKNVQEPTTSVTLFVTVTHVSFEFQFGDVAGFRLLDGQDRSGAFACVIKSQEFFL